MEIKFAIALAIMLTLLATGQAQNTYIPYELGGDNYYTMYGSPDISASVSGTDEFERGDTVTLYLDLTNYGRIIGFKEDLTPQNPKEFALAAAELQEEYKKPTALGITASLSSEGRQIDVKSGDQVVQSLKSGDKTQAPLKFTLKIGEHAPAGKYPLKLNMSYDYQDNVRVYASTLVTSGSAPTLANYRVSYIYQKANQTLPITITVKKQADFEILNNSGVLSVGAKKAPISATYKNIGEDPIKDAVARLSIFKPFSSTDDQAFIGTLLPGEEKTVVFRLDVDSDATPKDYGINSEIKYTDLNGDTVISESMKIPVMVKDASSSLLLPAAIVIIIIVAAGGYMYRKKQKKAS
ncbi:MAG: COG1361 S-layer family protein [Methanothrix sp.]